MFLRKKRRILDLLSLMNKILTDNKTSIKLKERIFDCMVIISLIKEELLKEETKYNDILNLLEFLRLSLLNVFCGKSFFESNIKYEIIETIEKTKTKIKHELKAKINVLFLPYKISMWDSLESIYEAALKDEDCIAKVVPIPYYELINDKKIPKYEGDKFLDKVPIIHYDNYNLEEEPDIIFVHNIYDNYNTLTQVYEQYFTSNLKKYTDMLVFVPYHISTFINKQNTQYLAYKIPTIKYVDKIILAGQHVKNAAIRDGISEDKLLVLGSPKFDKLIKFMKTNEELKVSWADKINGKFVFVLNTGCMFFSDNPFDKITLLINIFNIPNIVENSVIIWRPHPLTRVAIQRYRPELLEYYDTLVNKYIKNNGIFKNIIIDNEDDYLPALKVADVLISYDGSLLRSFLATKKKIIFLSKEHFKISNDFNSDDIFYYFFDENNHWSEIVKKLSQNYDPLSEKRSMAAEKFYVNIDGTCGEKVYYYIKNCIFNL
ncbi:hypothetical protein [Caloramator sp. ALD01]|uniref:hypothetical protein n=1 Tax=Caloramator sp. ALD01 TaxID=1031288 RepID=UPI0003F70329|nr:hypothetical protein [Caloramator sp. ALD01]